MTAPARRRLHVYPVDLVRVVTFACVVAVHTVSTTNPLDSVTAGGFVILLHFTREAFFVLTAFVLTHRYRDEDPAVLSFWRRRFLLVGVPYVVWSTIYTGLGLVTAPLSAPRAVEALAHNLLTGTAWYHVYFLLVSMQFYLVFPLFRRLLRATRGRHGRLLAASAALQVVIDLVVHVPAPTGEEALLLPYATSFLLSYQFFLVLGGVVALHLDVVDAWIRRHTALVVASAVVTGLLAESSYRWSLDHGQSAQFAADVFQPVLLPWSVAIVAACYALGAAWSDRRDRWAGSTLVEGAAARSFGVFLVHPAILWALTVAGPAAPAALLPRPWETVAAYLVAILCSLGVVELARRTPLSLVLTGRARPRPRPAPTTPQPVPVLAGTTHGAGH